VEFSPPDYAQKRPSRTDGTHPSVNVRVPGIGELTDHTTHWLLTYDACHHGQAFARVGMDEHQAAAAYVRRHYARCLTCGLATRPVAVHTSNVAPELMLSPRELTTIVTALRAFGQSDLAGRLEEVLQHVRRTAGPPRLP
jgi:uncharacterized protein involved in type VI secretion and phage assembly